MERLTQLIGKLNEQFEQNADYKQLLVTTQLIESELLRLSAASRQVQSTSKVAVVMPASRQVHNTFVVEKPVVERRVQEPIEEKAKEVPEIQSFQQPEPAPAVEPVPEPVQEPVTAKNGNGAYGTAVNGSGNSTNGNGAYHNGANGQYVHGNGANGSNGSGYTNGQQNGLQYNPLTEIPTLAHQSAAKELNELMAGTQTSLNDKLKEERVEVGHRLTDSPVRDLKKAIGINDRYVFISELFRGDEVMYERSIKTINSFRIYPEAQYWIERELKVKLGWDETRSATRHFYQLVKRRFS